MVGPSQWVFDSPLQEFALAASGTAIPMLCRTVLARRLCLFPPRGAQAQAPSRSFGVEHAVNGVAEKSDGQLPEYKREGFHASRGRERVGE
jgi:hypothetical protein